jgi:hypothetical protein
MSNTQQELSPSDWQIDEVPFEQLAPYDQDMGLYEIDRRPEVGYDVVTLFRRVGGEAILLTRVEQGNMGVFDVDTPPDKAHDHLLHAFPNAPKEKIEVIFPPKQNPNQIAA